MDYNKIINLIDKYWNGESSLVEEQEIKSFFRTHDSLPSHLEQYRKWFIGIDDLARTTLGEDFDNRILAEIEKRPVFDVRKRSYKNFLSRWRIVAVSVAASLFFLLGWMKLAVPELKMTYDEAQETILLVKDVLYFTSANLNKVENIACENLGKINVMNEYIKINGE